MRRGPHVERGAPPDDQISVTDELGGERCGEPAGDAERPAVAFEQAVGNGARRQERAGWLGEINQGLPATGASRPAPGDEHRPSAAASASTRRASPTSSTGAVASPARRGRARRRTSHLCALELQRQVENDGATLVPGRPEARGRVGDGGVRSRDAHRHRTDRLDESRLVDVEVRVRCSDLGGEHEQRRPALGRFRDARHRVRQPAALVDRDRGNLAARARVGVGHRRRAVLVAGGDEPGPGGNECVGEVEVAGADDAEDLADAAVGQRSARQRRQRSPLHQGEHPRRTARAGDDRQRRGHDAATPVGGSSARRWSWVRPYLPLPSRKEWQGKAGSNECAAPASVPDRLHADPDHRRLLGDPTGALDRDARCVRAGLVDVEERVLLARAGVPSRCDRAASRRPGAARARCSHRLTSSTSSRKSASSPPARRSRARPSARSAGAPVPTPRRAAPCR